MFRMLKMKKYILLMLQNITQIVKKKTNYSFNDSKWKGMALSCSKINSSIIKRNNF